MITYAALRTKDSQSIEVINGSWGTAYLMKAYALTELHQLDAAQAALQSAVALSPMNSQFLSELGYTYTVQKNWDKTLATYIETASMAELTSGETKTDDLTRAWRGQGYCLVEQQKLADAESMYQKALALDPDDAKSKGELNYIRRLMKQ